MKEPSSSEAARLAVPVLLVMVMSMPGAILSTALNESVMLLLPAMSLNAPPRSWMVGVASDVEVGGQLQVDAGARRREAGLFQAHEVLPGLAGRVLALRLARHEGLDDGVAADGEVAGVDGGGVDAVGQVRPMSLLMNSRAIQARLAFSPTPGS